MFKHPLFFLFFFCFLLSGCSQIRFMAVSVDSKNGGIYRISDQGSRLLCRIPTLNYLIYAPESSLYFGTANRHPLKKDKNGAVAVLRKQGENLELLQIVSAEGRTPCHLTLSPDGKFLYTANYSSGDISEFRIDSDRILSPARLIRHTGSGAGRRQRSPHPHFAGFDPAGTQLFVSDLGTDEIWIYDWHKDKGIIAPCSEKLKLSPGSGPRHLTFSPSGKVLYTANELAGTVSSFAKMPNGKWHHVKTISTLPFSQAACKNFPGAVKTTRCGNFLFVTNRGHNSLAFFKTDSNGDLRFISAVPSGGDYPSDLLIFENKNLIAVIHLKSDRISFMELEKKTEKLILLPQKSITVFKGIGLCR